MSDLVIYMPAAKWPAIAAEITRSMSLPSMGKRVHARDRVVSFRVLAIGIAQTDGVPSPIAIGERLYLASKCRIQAYAIVKFVRLEQEILPVESFKLISLRNIRRKKRRKTIDISMRKFYHMEIVVSNEWVPCTLPSNGKTEGSRAWLYRYIKPFKYWMRARFNRADLIRIPISGSPEYEYQSTYVPYMTLKRGMPPTIRIRDMSNIQRSMLQHTGEQYVPYIWECENGTAIGLIRRESLDEFPPITEAVYCAGPRYYPDLSRGTYIHSQWQSHWKAITLGGQYDDEAAYNYYTDLVRQPGTPVL